jgi:hypothetical protein
MFAKPKGYLATVCVHLSQPLTTEDGDTVRGYYVVLGVSTRSSDPRSILSSEVTDGIIDWSDTSWHLREPADAEDDIKRSSDPKHQVWYRSGRMFFP